jgi:hypothetical protein
MKPRTLAVLAAVVAILAVIVLVDRPARPPVDEDRLLPGFDAARVTSLVIRAPGRGDAGADVRLERRDGALVLVDGARAIPTDDHAVSELLRAVAIARFDRRIDRSEAQAARELHITDDRGATRVLRLGDVDPRTGWAIARVDGIAGVFLVDEWVACGLDRGAKDLRDHAPFQESGRLPPISIDADGRRLSLAGDPVCVQLDGGCARADLRRVRDLAARLLDLRVTRFLDPGVSIPTASLRVVVGRDELAIASLTCPGAPAERMAASRLGPVCVGEDVVSDLAAAAADPIAWVEPSLVTTATVRVRRIEIVPAQGDPLVLEREGAEWWFVDRGARAPAHAAAVRDWLDEVGSFRAASIAPAAAPPAGAVPRLTITSDAGSETIVLLGVAGGRARFARPGEPIALETHAEVARAVIADRLQLRDRALVGFDGWSLSAIELQGAGGLERVERGESADDWTVTSPIRIAGDPDAVGALRDAADDLTARRAVAERASPEHGLDPPRRRVTFVVDPPPTSPPDAPPLRHVLDLGARLADGSCFARAGSDPTVFQIGADECEAIDAHFATREVHDLPIDELTEVSIGGTRWEKQGAAWYVVGGGRISDHEAASIVGVVRGLAVSPEAQGYDAMAAGATEVVIRTARETITLRVLGRSYARDGRSVRYRVASEVCDAMPRLCR